MFIVDPSGVTTIVPAANDTALIPEAEQKERFASDVAKILRDREQQRYREFTDGVFDALKRKP